MIGDPHRVRQLEIEHLIADEAALRARVTELDADVRAFRELAQTAIAALHDLTVQLDRLRGQHQKVVDEYRALRERIMREAEGRAA
jgi:predicted  nucleic acid-binding Zn-ribbon protein